jgi:luciferase family oxidoreductase group 1
VAEHHNLPAIASSAPEIMIGQIAAATRRLRVGSGGVMLPNHAPLMVAERFKVLEALFPGRIDLGLGRAPGTDPATSYMLRRRQGISEEDDFLERFQELMLLETRGFPQGHPFAKVTAMPSDVRLPPIFLLGSSDYSAQLAGQIGAAFAFAHHFANFDAGDAMRLYRESFRPSPAHEKPYAILATHVVCADTDAQADRLAKTVELNAVRRAKGEHLPLASPDDAAAYDYSPIDKARIAQNASRLTVGAPATVQARLAPLLAATQADELMVTSMIYDHDARKHSYELLAQAFGLRKN